MWPAQFSRTFCALMVMPRSRSRSIESRYCARMSRGSTAPVSSRMRSARVDFPWSTWATMLKLRKRSSPGTSPLSSRAAGNADPARAGGPILLRCRSGLRGARDLHRALHRSRGLDGAARPPRRRRRRHPPAGARRDPARRGRAQLGAGGEEHRRRHHGRLPRGRRRARRRRRDPAGHPRVQPHRRRAARGPGGPEPGRRQLGGRRSARNTRRGGGPPLRAGRRRRDPLLGDRPARRGFARHAVVHTARARRPQGPPGTDRNGARRMATPERDRPPSRPRRLPPQPRTRHPLPLRRAQRRAAPPARRVARRRRRGAAARARRWRTGHREDPARRRGRAPGPARGRHGAPRPLRRRDGRALPAVRRGAHLLRRPRRSGDARRNARAPRR